MNELLIGSATYFGTALVGAFVCAIGGLECNSFNVFITAPILGTILLITIYVIGILTKMIFGI